MAFNSETLRLTGGALFHAVTDALADNATQWAAAIAYYGFLSLFPLTLAAVSLSSYFVSPDWAVTKAIVLLRELTPEGGQAVERIIHDAVHATHPYAGVVSLLVLLFLGSRVFGALSRALNVAYEGVESGGLMMRIAVEIGMMAAIGALFIVTLFSHHMLSLLRDAVRLLPGDSSAIFTVSVEGIRLILTFAAFFLIYRFVPRKRLDWKSICVGAAIATVSFVAARPLFYGYVENLANYNLLYGGIALAVVLLVWGWVAAFITILGGEVAAHFQTAVLEKKPAKRRRPAAQRE